MFFIRIAELLKRANHSVFIPVTDTESSHSLQNPSFATGRQVFCTPHFRETGAISVVTNAIRIKAENSHLGIGTH